MPVFEVQGPDGKVYEVDAPDIQRAVVAFGGAPVQHAPGITEQRGEGSTSAEYEGANSGLKGDKRAGTRLDTKLGGHALQGTSLGFADEGFAGLYTPFVAAANLVRGDGPTSFGEVYDQELALQRDQLKAAEIAHPIAAPVAEIGGALLTAKAPLGLISKARNVGEAALASAGTGAVMGGIGGFGSGEGSLDGRLQGAKTGAFVGGLAGVAAPAIGATIGKVISPFQTSSTRNVMADYLRSQGINVTAGQRTGSHALRYAESELGGQRAAQIMERQGEQFTSAALKKAGINADRATPGVIDDAFTRIGRAFDGLASRNMLQPDKKMLTDLDDVLLQYHSLTSPSQRAPIIQNIIDDLKKNISLNGPSGTDALQGVSYRSLRPSLDGAARATNDPQLVHALRGLKDAIDEAMERSIAKINPRDLGAWREARRQDRNMLMIEKAATGAGENAALGLISPSELRNAIVQQGRRGYARGRGDFANLARAGEALMKPLPNSDTPGRTVVRALETGIPALLGGGFGAGAGGPIGAMTGMAAGALLPKIAGALMMSRPGQAYLANRVVSPELKAIANALMVSGGSAGGRLIAP